jgi:chromate transporter
MDILCIAESTPGPISINASTFIGYKVGGFWGALASTIGLVLPSLIIITLLSFVYHEFSQLTLVNKAFRGILAAVVILIGSATIKLGKKVKPTLYNGLILITAFGLSYFLKINAIYLIAGGAFIGILYYTFLARRAIK